MTPMASGCRVHPTDFPGCGNCLGTLPRDVAAMRTHYGGAPAWSDDEVIGMYETYVGPAPRTVRQQVEDIQEHTERIRAIGADLAEESSGADLTDDGGELPDLCRCGAEFDGECSRCNEEDEQEALGERDGEMADDERRFGV